jgi:hypothetical protein
LTDPDLVLRVLVTTHEVLEREGLTDAALSAHIALLTSEGRAERRRDAKTAGWSCRPMVATRTVAPRYADRMSNLFLADFTMGVPRVCG